MSNTKRNTAHVDNPDRPPSEQAEINPMSFMLQMQQQQLAMQDQMARLMARLLPAEQNAGTSLRQQRVKPERPVIEADSSDNKWIIFQDAWSRYKQMTLLTDPIETRNELRSACSSSVNEMLFNFVGPDALNNATEQQLMGYIKSVAVKSIHPEVYRQRFFTMKQSDGETITAFISRLKSQAMLCTFERRCGCDNQHGTTSYAEDMIKSQIIAGLRNTSHQSRILTEIFSLPTLGDLVERLLTLESTARATSHFQPIEAPNDIQIAPIKSEYQHNKTSSQRPPLHNRNKGTSDGKCKGCGYNTHPKGRRQCPAWGKSCHKCGTVNHFSSVCRGIASSNTIMGVSPNHEQDENVSFISTMCTQPQL